MYSDENTLKERDSKLYDLYKASFYTDVILKVKEESLSVHGIILSSVSEYFQVMLQSGFRESSTRIIDFTTSFEDMAVLKIVVDYMYTGKVSLRQHILEQVLGAAHLFMLNGLKEHCAQFLLEQLQPQNALWTWRLAHLYDMAELEVVCLALLLTVFTQHLVDKTDMRAFTPDCLSALLNCDNLIQSMQPRDVAYLIVSWLKAGDFESRKELSKTLLLKYLKDQALDVILESIHNLSCYGQASANCESSPTIPNFVGKISWSSCQETEQGISQEKTCSSRGNYNGLLVYEDSCKGLSFFCQENNRWSYETVLGIGQTPLGIIDSCYLVSIGNDPYTIHLTNLNTKTVETPVSILRTIMREGRVINPGKEAIHYFCCSGRLYVMMNLWARSSDLVLSLYQFDVINNWSLLLDITQELDNRFLPGSFTREDVSLRLNCVSLDGNDVLIVAKLSLKNPLNNSGSWTSEPRNDRQHANVSRYPRSLCNLYRVNLCKGSYDLLSTGWKYVSNAQLENAFFSKEKLFFPDEKLQKIEQLAMSDGVKINCICYDMNSNEWSPEELTLPSIELEPLPLKQDDFPRSSIKMHGSVLYVGVHRAPHMFNVYLFQFDTFQWQKLPPIPSSSVSQMTLYPISAKRPVTQYLRSDTSGKQVNNSDFLFLNTSLQSWRGSRTE